MKPYIICHMMASIDGRIDCDMTERIGETNITKHWSNWLATPIYQDV